MADNWSSKVVKGIGTSDGAGAASVSVVTTGYKLRRARIIPLSTTGGTITVKDNNGLGSTYLTATATGAAKSSGALKATITSPVVIAGSGLGATKKFMYQLVLKK